MPEYVKMRIEEATALRALADKAIEWSAELEATRQQLEQVRLRAENAEEALRLAADEGIRPW